MAHDQIKLLRAAVRDAESKLTAARANMERAADRFGISHHGLFANSTFIARTTGQRWADRAKRDGLHEGIRDGFLMAWRTVSGKGPFEHLRGVKLGLDQPATSAAHAMVRALVAVYNDKGGKKSEPAPTATAKQILDAAALRDAGGHIIPPPPPGSPAAQMIEAARKNREGEGSNE